ncbi:MAG: family 16 glycoside hydrolase [Opitutaceae bacterium]
MSFRRSSRCVAALIVALPVASTAAAEFTHFDDAKPGALPSNWLGTLTGNGSSQWSIVREASAPSAPHVLKQSGVADYPLCLKTDATLGDGFVEVKFKPVSGREDQSGGVVWRAKDANHYYVARANALENNVRIYRVVAGQRIQLGTANAKVAGGQWHTLRVEFEGSALVVIFDGKQVLAAKDPTFTAPGLIGVWTKADSVTLFDDFGWGPKS